jgi:hypothetical protein
VRMASAFGRRALPRGFAFGLGHAKFQQSARPDAS